MRYASRESPTVMEWGGDYPGVIPDIISVTFFIYECNHPLLPLSYDNSAKYSVRDLYYDGVWRVDRGIRREINPARWTGRLQEREEHRIRELWDYAFFRGSEKLWKCLRKKSVSEELVRGVKDVSGETWNRMRKWKKEWKNHDKWSTSGKLSYP